MNSPHTEARAFDLTEWAASMSAAIEDIGAAGQELVAVHRRASARAEEVCRNWRLEERQAEQREALDALFSAASEILDKLSAAEHGMAPGVMAAAAACIDRNLPAVEEAFLVVRHCAQDLLQWAERHGDPASEGLTASYRALHGKLTAYAPVFKPRLEAFQLKLAERAAARNATPAVGDLLSAITRYNAVLDSARRFVAAVVEPPLELVFAETDLFQQDVQRIPVETRGRVGSELNDCCQHLLYEPGVFAETVRAVELVQPEGVDSSLVVFESQGIQVLLTVEEDPIFGQMTVHLLRAVMKDEFSDACAGVAAALSEEWN